MKRIININLSGRVIPIEDSAYESLQQYVESLRRYFAAEEGRDEIINDIESRIAELMSDKIKKGAAAVTDADITEIILTMGRIEDFEQAESGDEEKAAPGQYATGSSSAKSYSGRLYRDSSDKLIGGVCSGIAAYANVDPAIVRLLFAIITFGGFGAGVFLYILLWIILPTRPLQSYSGKRLFRNPEEKVFAGVAGGLAAYLNKPVWAIRLIFAAPLLLNILYSILNGFVLFNHDVVFPNLFIGSLNGTFILAYIVLWIVLPEATSPVQKMEMRGEKVDVNSIRQNVRDEMENIRTQTKGWTEEIQDSARQFSGKARSFAGTRGRAFAAEVSNVARPAASGLAHAIGVIFKAFFIFIAGCIALSIFACLIALLFGGFAWQPVNAFLWSSRWQQALAWLTLILFLIVPVIGFLVWLIRRITSVRSKNRYLGWTFGGLWALGWICVVMFAASVARDLSNYETVSSDLSITQPKNKMIVKMGERPIRYRDNGFWWTDNDIKGFDITADTMRYSNVKIEIEKSSDSLYHVIVHKQSAGSSIRNAEDRAAQTVFNISSVDSLLNLGSGVAISRDSKFRGQGVTVEIQMPAGKEIRFDESLDDAYGPFGIRRISEERSRRYWGRYSYRFEHYSESIDWASGKDYVMTTEGRLVEKGKEKENLEELKRENEEQQRKIKELEEKNGDDSTDGQTGATTKHSVALLPSMLFLRYI